MNGCINVQNNKINRKKHFTDSSYKSAAKGRLTDCSLPIEMNTSPYNKLNKRYKFLV